MPTVEEFVSEYVERYAKVRKKSWREDARQLDLDVVPVIGALKVRDVSKRHVLAIMDRIERRGHPKQAGECLKVVRRMFGFAIERDLIERALKQTQGNVTHAARFLKISRKGLQLKMKELGLREREQD